MVTVVGVEGLNGIEDFERRRSEMKSNDEEDSLLIADKPVSRRLLRNIIDRRTLHHFLVARSLRDYESECWEFDYPVGRFQPRVSRSMTTEIRSSRLASTTRSA